MDSVLYLDCRYHRFSSGMVAELFMCMKQAEMSTVEECFAFFFFLVEAYLKFVSSPTSPMG